MEEDNPAALVDICLAWVCHSMEQLCVKREDGSLCFHHCPVFPQLLADQLLSKMAEEGVLNDSTIGVFRSHEHLRLRRVCLRASHLSAEAFCLATQPHRLQELDASRVHGGLTVSDVLLSLTANTESSDNLQRLNLSRLEMGEGFLENERLSFSSMPGLRTVLLAGTELDDSGLQDLCTLLRLEALDISSTCVTDLTPLLDCQATLMSLSAHGLRHLEMPAARLLLVLGRLKRLRHLDLSDDRLTSDGDGVVEQLLEKPGILPALLSLDMSGRRGITDNAVQAFLEARPNMTFIGLLATGAGFSDFFTVKSNLKVAGEANIHQISEALKRYCERECFIREALVHLYSLTNDTDEPQSDVLKLVIMGMKSHEQSLHVQLVATACIFNLTTQDKVLGMPLCLLRTTVHQLLIAMRHFPNHEQLQKNCLLSLCNDRILQDVPFDRFDAAKLVMSWLSSREDHTLQRMAVAIVSILVSKLTTEETTRLGAEAFIMEQLLSIVQQKASAGVVDSTLKFALSALWNLTDESPAACRHFLQCQGLELYTEVLESYYTESCIQQKVMGLLNNIAEVVELRADLMDEDLLEHVLTLLGGADVEVGVSYFAGGILANLTSTGVSAWTLDLELRDTILSKLHSAILTWTPPQHEMVSYRSFQPFYPLLNSSQPTGVQLWAAWAVHLVCRQNASQYASMLQEEGGLDILKSLILHPDTHDDVRKLAESIVGISEQAEQARREREG
ncbi:protein zyg-11 homolog isoform X1 [Alosa pseudoharengus]|uniref:protein zyg-11 homolog isoform X1 n=2 Tax=Alosa pseudoharengus TaxID=34774 RepID=UPI003F8A1D79